MVEILVKGHETPGSRFGSMSTGNNNDGKWIDIEMFSPMQKKRIIVGSINHLYGSQLVNNEGIMNSVNERIKYYSAQLQLLNVLCKGGNPKITQLVLSLGITETECRLCLFNDRLSSEIRTHYGNLYATLFIEALPFKCVPRYLIMRFEDIQEERSIASIAAATSAFSEKTASLKQRRMSVAKVHPSPHSSVSMKGRKSFGGRGRGSFAHSLAPSMSRANYGTFEPIKAVIKAFLDQNGSQNMDIALNNIIASVLNVLRLLLVEDFYSDSDINFVLPSLLDVLDGRNDECAKEDKNFK
ncbi:hypothetical protein HK096_010320 [Nowakowskiella sp. JEL0078]|nr:hypothetical protein HK096_010320 [Nowakowskiella sp. JEL0078]